MKVVVFYVLYCDNREINQSAQGLFASLTTFQITFFYIRTLCVVIGTRRMRPDSGGGRGGAATEGTRQFRSCILLQTHILFLAKLSRS